MTLTLSFIPEGNNYVATFVTASRYALHIEQEQFGRLSMQLKSVESGEYADCEDQLRTSSSTRPIYDKDFNHGVCSQECPKWIKIISRTPVVKAFVIGAAVSIE